MKTSPACSGAPTRRCTTRNRTAGIASPTARARSSWRWTAPPEAHSKQALPVRDVDPAAELESVLAKMRDPGEAKFFVQGNAGGIGQRGAANHAMNMPRAQCIEQTSIQHRAESTTRVRRREIDRTLHCKPVADARFPWRGIGVACNVTVTLEHQPRQFFEHGTHARLHFARVDGSFLE